MGKVKQVRFGRVVKKRDEADATKFFLSIKQHGKLSGAESRRLKAQIEAVCDQFLKDKYEPVVVQPQN